MRRLSRIDRPIGLLNRQQNTQVPSPYLCQVCRHRNTFTATSYLSAAPSRETAPFTEKVRRKIWGTDQPPGLDDPYGKRSVLERTISPEQKLETREPEPEPETTDLEVEPEDSDNINAKRATTWDDLQWVGGGPVWQPETAFKGFLRANPTALSDVLTASLHRAVVEVFALQQAGKPLHELSNHFSELDVHRDWTDDVQITPSSNGATVQMPKDSSLEEILKLSAAPEPEAEPTESEEDLDADRSEVDPLESGTTSNTEDDIEQDKSEDQSAVDHVAEGTLLVKNFEDVISSWDPSWLQISLEDPEIKFVVLKRTMQLTGIRIPDAAMKSLNSVKALLNVLITPPKPRKLFDALSGKTDLSQLGNVSIYRANRGFVSKERDIGRLKVIRAELHAKQLEFSK